MSDIEIETISHQGKRLSIKGAFVGSIVFSFVDLVNGYVNAYIIQHIDTSTDIVSIIFTAVWFFAVILSGFALAFFPARFFGGFLARSLHNDFKKHKLTKKIAFTKGAFIGALSSMVICLPILLLEYAFIEQTGHGDFSVFIYRTIEATVIASLTGAWCGMQIEKILLI